MIGRLRGTLVERGLDHILIDVGGVGYVVTVSDRVLAALPGVGEAVAVHTDLLVREDLLQLFGFLSVQEREWHRLLMSVQGIGAKASMAILGVLSGEGVGRAIALGDWNAVAAAKGVGPKTAQRVVRELKDKAPAVMAMGGGSADKSLGPSSGGSTLPDPHGDPHGDPHDDPNDDSVIEMPEPVQPGTTGASEAEALSALANLGYGPGEAASAVAEAANTGVETTSDLIRAALKLLAPRG